MTRSSEFAKRIEDKKRELQSLYEFRELTLSLCSNMLLVGDKFDKLELGTATVADVLGSWGSVVEAASLASINLLQDKQDADKMVLPESLVRVKVSDDSVQ